MSILSRWFSCLLFVQNVFRRFGDFVKVFNFLRKATPGKAHEDNADSVPVPYDNVDYSVVVSEIKPLEDVMIGFAVALKERHTVENEIELLSAIIESFYSLKSKCVSLGPEYLNYFSQMWEHCQNSQNQDYSYIERFEERLVFLQKEKNVLLAKEELKTKEMVNLDQRIIEILKSEKEILQTDIYKYFDPVVQSEISSILYFMAKNGEIHRTKSGRTYLITYQN